MANTESYGEEGVKQETRSKSKFGGNGGGEPFNIDWVQAGDFDFSVKYYKIIFCYLK